MSDTPRTDAAKWHCRTPGDPTGAEVVFESFALQLERELNAANERIKQLEAELESYRSWNMALRKVGDDMDYRLTLHASHEPVLKKWKAIRNGNPNDDSSATS